MEKALTKVSSLKVGGSWISKKAKEELSNITQDINLRCLTAVYTAQNSSKYVVYRFVKFLTTISSTVEEKAKWIFNKLKGASAKFYLNLYAYVCTFPITGKPTKSLPELLREYNLPAGLFPQNIICYEFDETKAKLTVYLPSVCEVIFKDSSVIRYATRVKAILMRGKLSGIEGMKTKVLVWVKVTCVSIESYKSDKHQRSQRKRQRTQQQGQQQIKGEEHDQKSEQNLVLGRESNIDNSKLTSFLVQEDSFLTPWNWSGNNKSEGKDDQNHSTSNSRIGEQQRLHLEPGSYFSYNVCEDALPYFFSVVVNRAT
ncbi:hypothetical protein KPL71_013522 [Citrus sinensis]|uniref:Uncharacterized protein n=1 Tax=Citrus sinensis TaxID=2711 RepID=A0ACB8LKU1_CITSI|nr:hypothetical protein KPL71_013522 [Citrus sinensis]